MSLVQRARESGTCPPSLLSEDRVAEDHDGFADATLQLLDTTGLALSSEPNVPTDFKKLLQLAEGIGQISGDVEIDKKKAVLEFRRCILLAIVGSTSSTNSQLKVILSEGLLVVLKAWLDDILDHAIGGVDMLLHFLTNITNLPVTKSIVVSSGLAKAVGALEKHKICVGTKNESAICTRVQLIKDAWNAAVKVNKEPKVEKAAPKRPLESSGTGQNSVKKARVDEQSKKSSSLSSLLSKVSAPGSKPPAVKTNSSTTPASADGSGGGDGAPNKTTVVKKVTNVPKKPAKRVKWVDHFGGDLESAHVIGGEGVESAPTTDEKEAAVSWTDRKKRDRLREKELIAKAKKAKLVDDDDDPFIAGAVRMKPSLSWHQPRPLPERSDVTKAQCDSKELTVQTERMRTVTPARYSKEEDVPNSPAQMSDVEQALDVAAQASAVVGNVPFFVVQQNAAPAMAPAPSYAVPEVSSVPVAPLPVGAMYPAAPVPAVGATSEMVQSMGLPLFLTGSNVQALQTLASTPSLLNTFVDANGMYDQTRLMSLVQTLTQNIAPSQPAQQLPASMYQHPASASTFTPQTMSYQPPVAQTSAYEAPKYGMGSSYGTISNMGHQGKSDAGNLHVSGYGPTTTQSDIISLFAPYVHVDEVVMKSNFSFVNTSDPDGAKRAREALQGAMLGGMPIRINPAQRRSREPTTTTTSVYGAAPAAPIRNEAIPLPRDTSGQIDYSSVRDDRGNPATKNLFVAGYGSGTSEQVLRDTFAQHATITSVVMKGSFSFVNTSDRVSAVHAREALIGAVLNGGVLRINFAKETGRLGTSFDTTYGPSTTQSHYMRPTGASY